MRRQITIEWEDDGTDTDFDCLKQFCDGEYTVHDLQFLDCKLKLQDAEGQPKSYAEIEYKDGKIHFAGTIGEDQCLT